MMDWMFGSDQQEEEVAVSVASVMPVAHEVTMDFEQIEGTLQDQIAELTRTNQKQTEMMEDMLERIQKLEEQVNKGAWDKFKEGLKDFGKKLQEFGQAIKNSVLVQWVYEGLCQIGCKIERAVANVQEKFAERSRNNEMASLDKAFEKAGNAIDKVANKRGVELDGNAHVGLGSDLTAAKAELEARHEQQRQAAKDKLDKINERHDVHKAARQEHGTKMQVAMKKAGKAMGDKAQAAGTKFREMVSKNKGAAQSAGVTR